MVYTVLRVTNQSATVVACWSGIGVGLRLSALRSVSLKTAYEIHSRIQSATQIMIESRRFRYGFGAPNGTIASVTTHQRIARGYLDSDVTVQQAISVYGTPW
jgi:hypothetical protein